MALTPTPTPTQIAALRAQYPKTISYGDAIPGHISKLVQSIAHDGGDWWVLEQAFYAGETLVDKNYRLENHNGSLEFNSEQLVTLLEVYAHANGTSQNPRSAGFIDETHGRGVLWVGR